MKLLLFIGFILITAQNICVAQNNSVDSLLKEIQNRQINKAIADKAITLSYDKIVNNLNTCLFIFESLNNEKIYYNQPLKLGDLKEKLALIYYLKGNYQKSSNLHLESISLFEKSGDKRRKANAMATLAYEGKKRNLKSSMNLMSEAIQILKNLNNALFDLSGAFDNYGILFELKGDLDSAIYYYKAALKLKTDNKDSVGIPYSLNNIAGIYFLKNNINEGLKYINKSTKIRELLKDYMGMAENENSLGELYFSLDNIALAKIHFQKSNSFSKKASYIDLERKNLKYLSSISAKQKKYDSAYYYYKSFFEIHDSIYNSQNQKQILEMETLYETEKKTAQIKFLDTENQLKENELEKKRNSQRFLLVIIALSIITGIIIFKAYLQKNKANQIILNQKKELGHQKNLIEEKHKEITDSINYAERIQRSFMATKQLLNENLDNYFVFFKPKDVVSGDFYWAGKLSNGNFALVTADSTGHGVPGAIMSILNISSLEKAVEQGLNEPTDILNHTRKTIIERLKKDGSVEGGKDGMDCSLMCFDFMNKKIIYAAANNPIWVVRENNLIELSPDKMPVGKHDKDYISFTQHEFQIQQNDMIYALTDGMPDQFGGEKGKKFMYKKLKELLISISYLPVQKQKEKLNEELDKWKGNLEQVDDILIIGIKLNL